MLGFMLRRATGAAARTNVTATTRRYMSSEVSLAEEIKEMKKWKVITFVALPFCVVKAAYDLSHGSHHEAEHISYPYLHIRSKDFPWGPDGLFEVKHE